MWCWALQSLRHQHLAPHSKGTHLSEVSSPVYTNSGGSATASVNKAPLKPAKRKEETMHASPGASCFPGCEHLALLSKAAPFFSTCDRQGRERQASLPPNQPGCLYSYTVPSPGRSARTVLCTSLVAQTSACLGHDFVLSSLASCRLAFRNRALGTWGSLVSKPEISTNFLCQRSWCCENCSYGSVSLFTFFQMLPAPSWLNSIPLSILWEIPILSSQQSSLLGCSLLCWKSQQPQAQLHSDQTHPVACPQMDATTPTVGKKSRWHGPPEECPWKLSWHKPVRQKSLFLSLKSNLTHSSKQSLKGSIIIVRARDWSFPGLSHEREVAQTEGGGAKSLSYGYGSPQEKDLSTQLPSRRSAFPPLSPAPSFAVPPTNTRRSSTRLDTSMGSQPCGSSALEVAISYTEVNLQTLNCTS